MTHVVIIGGNHGLGLAWTKYYLDLGYRVTATFRNREASSELFAIKSDRLTTIECDVTNKDDINNLEKEVLSFDRMIYNAGIKGYSKPFCKPEENKPPELVNAFKVNCEGLDDIIRAFYTKICAQPNCQLIYMSSGVSSTLDNASGGYHPYRISKAGGNACIRSWDIRVSEYWLSQGKSLTERPVLYALTPGLVDIGMGAGVKGARPVAEVLTEMSKVMNSVCISKDTHGLWTHSGDKLETYILPNVIKEALALQKQPKAILTAFEQTAATDKTSGKVQEPETEKTVHVGYSSF